MLLEQIPRILKHIPLGPVDIWHLDILIMIWCWIILIKWHHWINHLFFFENHQNFYFIIFFLGSQTSQTSTSTKAVFSCLCQVSTPCEFLRVEGMRRCAEETVSGKSISSVNFGDIQIIERGGGHNLYNYNIFKNWMTIWNAKFARYHWKSVNLDATSW